MHEWALRIDKSDRGHVFVGVVTADASMDSYIGSDRCVRCHMLYCAMLCCALWLITNCSCSNQPHIHDDI